MKQEQTGYGAKKVCERNGMQLFTPDSASLPQIVAFGREKFGGSPRAEVFVSGRRGNLCLAAKGDGKLKFVHCSTTLNFFCEMAKTLTIIQCSQYTSTTYDHVIPFLVTDACVYSGAISNAETILTTTEDKAKELILAVEFDAYSPETLTHFPINLAENFPNMEVFFMPGNPITVIPTSTFAGCSKLKFVRLNGLKIQFLNKDSFKDLVNLVRLDMACEFMN